MDRLITENLIGELPKGLVLWYSFQKGKRLLYLGQDEQNIDGIKQSFLKIGIAADVIHYSELESVAAKKILYDYIVVIEVLEKSEDPVCMLRRLYDLLDNNGVFLLGTDNRLAVRYFCGDTDKYTGRNFDSIEDYFRVGNTEDDAYIGRAYSKSEIQKMLKSAGFSEFQFYSVFPVLERPQILFSEDYIPKEDVSVRIAPQYNDPSTVFLDEERLYKTLMDNGLFHTMANGFLIECTKCGLLSGARQITVSMDRGTENAMATIIHGNNTVEKKAIYDEGKNKIYQILENHNYLRKHGIPVINADPENGSLIMPYIDNAIAAGYYADLFFSDKEYCLHKLDELWELILHSSEHVMYEAVDWEKFEPYGEKRKKDDPNIYKWRDIALNSDEGRNDLGPILKRGYIDLVSINSFIVDGSPLFFDQELFIENLPAKVILMRTIDFMLSGHSGRQLLDMKDELYERYGLAKYQDLFHSFISAFLIKFRNESELMVYNKKYRKDAGIVNSNRQRMNFSADEYQKIFYGLFKNIERKDIYVFGSGNFAKHFLSQYSSEYKISGILDNDPSKWGSTLSGITIYSPEHILSLPTDSYKIIICIKNYISVLQQIKKMDVSDYGIYDDNLKIERHFPIAAYAPKSDDKPKRYHIGYISGVFDLFHIGHLNMFKRAKEQCDYLIVGIVTDEGVVKGKKTMPFVPFAERMEMVRSCKYVDEVVEIPIDYPGTDEAYKRYQFDVQFSGSDYENDPYWLSNREFLRQNGSDLVFFPYTQETSSSKIKELIYKKLL